MDENERYNQPFCVLGKKRRFKGVRFGYLPPLEYPNGDDIETRMEGLEEWVNAIGSEPCGNPLNSLKRKKIT